MILENLQLGPVNTQPKSTIYVFTKHLVIPKVSEKIIRHSLNNTTKMIDKLNQETKLLSPKGGRFGSDCKSAKDNTQE